MGLFSKIFSRPRITTTANEYHMTQKMAENKTVWSRTSDRPLTIEKLYAKKNFLRDTWNLYAVTDYPSRPVGHGRGYTIDNRFGKPEIVAKNLRLREAFDRVRAHEEQPAQKHLKRSHWDEASQSFVLDPMLKSHYSLEADGRLFLVQKKPQTGDPSYWRNMALRA